MPVPRTASSPPRVSAWQAAGLLALLHGVLALLVLQPAPYIGGDNAAYLALARSLAERGAYLDLWDPAQPPHTQYPPLFPLLLAVALRAGVDGWVGLKLVTAACSMAAVGASYLWMRRATSPGIAAAAGGLLAILPGPLVLAHQGLSDVPFWAVALLALWAAARLDERDTLPRGLATALLASAAYLTRSAGLPLVLALAAAMLLGRRWRALAVLAAGVGIPAAAWWMRGRALGARGYTSYLWYLDPYQPALGTIGPAGLAARMGQNLVNYFGEHLPVVLGGATPARVGLAVAIGVLALAGWARRLGRPRAPEFFLPLYAGLLLVWPATWSGERFLLPILPLLLVYAGEALRDAAAVLRVHPLRAGAAATALAAALAIPGTLVQARHGLECSRRFRAGEAFPCLTPVWRDLFAVAQRSRGVLPPGAAVLSRKPTLFFALSGHPSRIYPSTRDPEEFFRAAREAGAEWVVIDRVPDLAPIFLHPVVRARPGAFCPVLVLPQATLARIAPQGC